MFTGVFRYPGGKSRVRKLILSYAPENYQEYREPFVGGGGIFWGVDQSKKRWINDINPGLMAVYYALRDRPVDFICKCRAIRPAQQGEDQVRSREKGGGKKTYNKRLKNVFDYLKYNEEVDQALRYFFLNRTVWGGRVNYDPAMESRMYYSNPQGWNIVNTNKLEKAAKILQQVHITNGDYKDLLAAPGDDVWIYLDPPYLKNTRLNRSDKLYQYGFSDIDHIHFVQMLHECPHYWCLSYDDDPKVRKWFSNFYIYEVKWKYSGTSMPEKKTGEELIITNYLVKHEKLQKVLC